MAIPDDPEHAARPHSRVAAIVLAAGMSRRMLGPAKCLLPIGGRPLVRHIVEQLLDVHEIRTRIVVTGHNPALVDAALLTEHAPLDVRIVHNQDYEKGEMLSSVKTGLRAVEGSADAVLIVLGDQPTFRIETVRDIIVAWLTSIPRPRMVRPTFNGKHGHPILLDAAGIDEILGLPVEATLKDYTSQYQGHTLDVAVDDSAILDDIDTPQDYERAVRWWRELGSDASAKRQADSVV